MRKRIKFILQAPFYMIGLYFIGIFNSTGFSNLLEDWAKGNRTIFK